MPAPVVLILAAGRGKRFLTSGKYHKLREKFAVAVLENHLNRLKERPTHSGCSSPCVTFSATRALAGLKRTGLLACCNKGQYARAKEQHTTMANVLCQPRRSNTMPPAVDPRAIES